MNTKDFAERIDEVTADARRRNTEPLIDSSIAETTPKKFGVGKKCLVVFAAALVASAIVHQLPGASTYTHLDKAFGVDPKLQGTLLAQATGLLGGATTYFLMAMVIAAFVRGSTGAITGVVLVGVWAYCGAYGMVRNQRSVHRSAVSTSTQQQPISTNPSAAVPLPSHQPVISSFSWKPSGSEYSVVFAGTPKISEVRGVGDSGELTMLQATYSGAVGFERAESLSVQSSWHITKETENTAIASWVRATGIEHYQVEFNDSNSSDIVTTFKGTKRISTDDGDVTMSIIAERHWAKHSGISLTICAPSSKSPTPEGMAFLESVRLEK